MAEDSEEKFDRGLKILEMTRTEGWQILKKEIEKEIEIEIQEILDCEPDQYLRHREAIRAYKKILSIVETAIAEKEEAADEMREK